jgi:hypothetical protein
VADHKRSPDLRSLMKKLNPRRISSLHNPFHRTRRFQTLCIMSANTTYTYTKLNKEKQEIRLLTLLPSQGVDDPIRIIISHVPFIVEEKGPSARPDTKEIRRSLPDGWSVFETMEGRLFFSYWDGNAKVC